jgi:hypothetical protein
VVWSEIVVWFPVAGVGTEVTGVVVTVTLGTSVVAVVTVLIGMVTVELGKMATVEDTSIAGELEDTGLSVSVSVGAILVLVVMVTDCVMLTVELIPDTSEPESEGVTFTDCVTTLDSCDCEERRDVVRDKSMVGDNVISVCVLLRDGSGLTVLGVGDIVTSGVDRPVDPVSMTDDDDMVTLLITVDVDTVLDDSTNVGVGVIDDEINKEDSILGVVVEGDMIPDDSVAVTRLDVVSLGMTDVLLDVGCILDMSEGVDVLLVSVLVGVMVEVVVVFVAVG